MTPERWRKVREVFEAALEAAPADRDPAVDRLCPDDAEVRAEVLSLLARHHAADGFLETPALAPSSVERVGPYRVLGVLGRGGMGIVYLAEQDHPRRRVALKVLRPDSLGGSAARRFEHEAQVLARLQHPGIAAIHEAGWTDIGGVRQPYFAMELVEGSALTEYAQAQSLDVPARLDLLARVCDAVEHAHQKGVIHRDLKPANILVDARAQPRVLDFGVSRLTDADVRATTLQTAAGQLIGTVAYMSPEQVRGDAGDLDTRSDVYTLGVILFELLTGRLPYAVPDGSIAAAVRVIAEAEPDRLGTAVRSLRGDLDTITAKALARDRDQRYQSAAALAADIRRFLADEPIAARPATTVYQLRKFARRHRALVGGIAATMLTLTGACVGMTLLYLHSRGETARAVYAEGQAKDRLKDMTIARDEAWTKARQAERTTEFLQDTLAAVDPEQGRGDSVRVRDVIDEAHDRIAIELADEPRVQAAVLETIGRAYYGLGVFDRSRAAYDRAVALNREHVGPDSADLASSLLHRSFLPTSTPEGRAAALADARESAAIRAALFGESDPRSVNARRQVAQVLWESGDAAKSWAAMVDMAIAVSSTIRVDDLPPEAREALVSARDKWLAGDKDEAGTILWQYRVDAAERLGKLWAAGRRDEALSLIRAHYKPLQAVALWSDHIMELLASVAGWLHGEGEGPDVIEPIMREALAIGELQPGVPHPMVVHIILSLGRVETERGRTVEAEVLFRRALDVCRQSQRSAHPMLADSLAYLGMFLADQGRAAEAEPLLAEAVDLPPSTTKDGPERHALAAQRLAELHAPAAPRPEAAR